MRNLAFVLWMILFPLSGSIQDYMQALQGKTYSEGVEGLATILTLVLWVFIGKLLYEKKVKS